MKRIDITTKKATLEILERLFDRLDGIEEDVNTKWGTTGKMKPKTRWNKDKDEYEDVLDDDGNVIMIEEYGSVPKDDDDYTDEDRAQLAAIKVVKAHLEKMI